MNKQAHIDEVVAKQKAYFKTGITKSVSFRKKQLKALKQAILTHEQEILVALHSDLRKPEFEAFSSEIGTLIMELNHTLNHLDEWTAREYVPTPLVIQPAKSFIIREPVGVVLIISPWNYPFMLAIAPLISAISAGNCAIVKPSNQSKASSSLIQKLITQVFDEAYVAVIEGPGSEAGSMLIEKHRFDHIFFTGSPSVGKSVMRMAAEHLSPVTLELGGKSPAIVDASADIKVSAKRIVWGKFWNAGQTCIAPDYILVHESIYEEFLAELKQSILAMFGDNPIKSDSYGRIINDRHFQVLKSYLDQGSIFSGGRFDTTDLYIEPTILTDVSFEDEVMKTEIFGPILPIFKYKDEDQVLEMVAKNPKPLACYVFSNKRKSQEFYLNAISFGGGGVNILLVHFAQSHLPLGGIGSSGMGCYHGKYGFETLSHKKAIVRSGFFPDVFLRYAPFGKLQKLVRYIMK